MAGVLLKLKLRSLIRSMRHAACSSRMRIDEVIFAPDLLLDVNILGELYGIHIRSDRSRYRFICRIRVWVRVRARIRMYGNIRVYLHAL